MSVAHLALRKSSQLQASLWIPHLPLKERCLSRACPRASCTFSIRVLHAPEEREQSHSRVRMVFYGTPFLPVTTTPHSPSKLSASTLNPSSLLISKRRCGPARFGARFSLSSGDGGSSSELEASPGPREQVRVRKDHPFWSQNRPVPHHPPSLPGHKHRLWI